MRSCSLSQNLAWIMWSSKTELYYISEFQNTLIGQSIEMMGLTDKVYSDKQCVYQATE